MTGETGITLISADRALGKELEAALPKGRHPAIRIMGLRRGHARGIVLFDIDTMDPSEMEAHASMALVIAVTARKDPDTVMRAVTQGAYEVLSRPLEPAALEGIVSELSGLAVELQKTVEITAPRTAPTCVIVGQSPSLIEICKRLARLSQVDVPVLITGETGTGKELIAESIAQFSRRFGKPFVVINCAAMPEALLESELFGFEKGAFTGAVGAKAGLLSIADTGTVFLDEVGELPLALQSKLLRFLQTQTFYPIGGTRERAVDVRVISATNRDIPAMVREGRFREDLYHRLRVAELHMPPLRERKTDIKPLLEFFVERYRKTAPRPIRGVTKAFLKKLTAHGWPGNIRELENAVRSAIAVSRTPYLTTHELADLSGAEHGPEAAPLTEALSAVVVPYMREAIKRGEGDLYGRLHAALDKPLLDFALSETRENQSEAARILGINRLTLRKKLGA